MRGPRAKPRRTQAGSVVVDRSGIAALLDALAAKRCDAATGAMQCGLDYSESAEPGVGGCTLGSHRVRAGAPHRMPGARGSVERLCLWRGKCAQLEFAVVVEEPILEHFELAERVEQLGRRRWQWGGAA